MKARNRNEAFALYLGGYSLRQVAVALKLGRSTVERWSLQDGWVTRRRRAHLTTTQEIVKSHAREEFHKEYYVQGRLFEEFKNVAAKRQAYLEGKVQWDPEMDDKKFLRLAKTLCSASEAFNTKSLLDDQMRTIAQLQCHKDELNRQLAEEKKGKS